LQLAGAPNRQARVNFGAKNPAWRRADHDEGYADPQTDALVADANIPHFRTFLIKLRSFDARQVVSAVVT
jgi:hypothetical protein